MRIDSLAILYSKHAQPIPVLDSSLYIYAPKSTQSILFLLNSVVLSHCRFIRMKQLSTSIQRVLDEFRFEMKENPNRIPLIAPIHFVPPPDSYSSPQWNGDETPMPAENPTSFTE
ncbi:hypothetical protein CEXT_719971 [Caerostris extrusa]|uniref:Uncharacterized protein n=1 Tax=Caerostris extrusa TaxID=172846 RepID=A0AAV4PTS8_CAEEX|nr:hypothetical protein CEXT_719971 [Caerostris extrusa]